MNRSEAEPWPEFFDIALLPRAYGALLYQIAGLPLGVVAFIWVVTGLSLSLGLAIVGIGLVLGLVYLLSSRALAVAQGRLAAALSGMPAPGALAVPEGKGLWSRLGALLSDPASWGAQACLFVRMPMGILSFSLLVTLFSLSLAAILTAILPWHLTIGGPDGFVRFVEGPWGIQGYFALPPFLEAYQRHPATARILSGAAGGLGLLASLHVALAFTRAEAWMARTLLRRRSPAEGAA